MHTRNIFVYFMALFLAACGGGGGSTKEPVVVEKVITISGKIQKGPFVSGSMVTAKELNDDLAPTGRSYQTTVISNLGDYVLDVPKDISYLEINAEGFYFDEISGGISDSKLKLSALTDYRVSKSINVNLLTDLTSKRIRKLVSQGSDYFAAKWQSETEVIEMFSFDLQDENVSDFELMDISQSGTDNAYLLLASSVLIESPMSDSALSSFIDNINSDTEDDGVVTATELLNLIRDAKERVNLVDVHDNLETYYRELGYTVSVPELGGLMNRAPVANITADQFSVVGSPVVLDGSKSSDIDGDELTFMWEITSKPDDSSAELIDGDLSEASFTPDVSGSYTFSLTVSDGIVLSSSQSLSVSTTNRPPVALAGDNREITVEDLVLDGSASYDEDNDQLAYLWSSDRFPETSQEAVWRVDASLKTLTSAPVTYTLRVTDEVGLYSETQVVVQFRPFSKVGSSGEILSDSASSWDCLRDNKLDVIWEIKTDDGGVRDVDWEYMNTTNMIGYDPRDQNDEGQCYSSNSDSDGIYCHTEGYISAVNTEGLCGAKNWRLPTLIELNNIRESVDLFGGSLNNRDYYLDKSFGHFYLTSEIPGLSSGAREIWGRGYFFGLSGEDSVFSSERYNPSRVRLVRDP